MRKSSLRLMQTAGMPMSTSEAIVRLAQTWTAEMLHWESRGPGDMEPAMTRLANRHSGVTKGLLWNLRYRPPKRIWGDALIAIRAAYEKERQRQLRALDAQTKRAAEQIGPDHHVVVAATGFLINELGLVEAGAGADVTEKAA